jgi:hypothetical protein
MKRLTAAAILFALLLIPGTAYADDGAKGEDFILHVRGDVRVAQGEKVGAIVVIDGNAVIEGEVDESVTVISGNATVTGRIGGNLTVISGDIDLKSAAHVNNVFSIRGDLTRAEGATITGEVRERDSFGVAAALAAAFSIIFWLGLTIAAVVAGLIFAAVGGRQLQRSAQAMTGDAIGTIAGVVFVWVAVPTIAVVAIATLIGIPLGLGLLLFLLPALWFLGYIVAGARIGSLIADITGRGPGDHPYAATTLGLVLLQLLVLIPVLGALIALFAGVWGAGAIACHAYRSAGGKGLPAPDASKSEHQPPAPAQGAPA